MGTENDPVNAIFKNISGTKVVLLLFVKSAVMTCEHNWGNIILEKGQIRLSLL